MKQVLEKGKRIAAVVAGFTAGQAAQHTHKLKAVYTAYTPMRLVMGISHQIIVLHHGRVIAQGPPGEIQSHPEVIRAYLGGV